MWHTIQIWWICKHLEPKELLKNTIKHHNISSWGIEKCNFEAGAMKDNYNWVEKVKEIANGKAGRNSQSQKEHNASRRAQSRRRIMENKLNKKKVKDLRKT